MFALLADSNKGALRKTRRLRLIGAHVPRDSAAGAGSGRRAVEFRSSNRSFCLDLLVEGAPRPLERLTPPAAEPAPVSGSRPTNPICVDNERAN
jgi:hypothetical protein